MSFIFVVIALAVGVVVGAVGYAVLGVKKPDQTAKVSAVITDITK